jgi:hypothetical protein
VPRDTYLRGGQAFDQRLTAKAIDRVADMLDLADNQVRTAVYPELGIECSDKELALAWCWVAVLIADQQDAPTAMLRQLSNAIGMMADDVQ